MTTEQDNLKGRKFPILTGDSYVSLVDVMGTDTFVVQAQRVSPPEVGAIHRHAATPAEVEKIKKMFEEIAIPDALVFCELILFIHAPREATAGWVKNGSKGATVVKIDYKNNTTDSYWKISLFDFFTRFLFRLGELQPSQKEVVLTILKNIVEPLFPAVVAAYYETHTTTTA